MEGATRANAERITGRALLEYDFSNDNLDLTLDQLENQSTGATPPPLIWSDLQQNDDGSFYIQGYGNDRAGTDLHPTLGYVDGDFYGPNAEEFAGVFERSGIVGSFGGKRQPAQ